MTLSTWRSFICTANDPLYDPLPVTMAYAKVLTRVIKRMNGLGSALYQFRFFM